MLTGFRVLEVADTSAVFAGRLLADLGAEVIRVEGPDGGRLRRLAPFLGDEPGVERSLQHLYHDAGKRSVVIDRTTAAGRERFGDLVASADAVLETERLDPGELRGRNPGLVHVTVTPFGLEGPWSDRRGSDLVASAAGGFAFVCGSPKDPPSQPGADQSYKMAGLVAAAGTAIALVGRERQGAGRGVHLDVSVQEATAMAVLQTSNPALWVWNGRVPERPGLTLVHKCSDDRWVTISVPERHLGAFCEWAAEAGVEVPEGMAISDVRDVALTVRAVAERYPRDEFMQRAWDLGLHGLPVSTLPDLETLDHFVESKQFLDVPHPPLETMLPFPRSPVDGLGGVELRRAPTLGEHTEEVLSEATPRPPTESEPLDLPRALEGVRVVDFCWVIAGPLGTRILANFGAEVIRIESEGRNLPDVFPEGCDDPSVGAYHNTIDTQKKSITVDPRTPRGRELLLELIRTADVVTSNYRPGTMDAMGYGYEVLREVNPRIISLEVPGSGSTGPWSRVGSFGNMVSAAAGISELTGFDGRAPRGVGVAYPDFTSPYLMTLLVLAALRERDRTGTGKRIELNQLSATVSLVGVEWLQYASTGTPPPRRANRDPNHCPHGIYPSTGEDEWVAIAVDGDEAFAGLCEAMGRPELAEDPRFSSHDDRKANEDALDEIVRSWTTGLDKWESADLLQSRGVAAAPVENLRDTMERDPQLARHYRSVHQPSHPNVRIPIQGEAIREASVERELGRAPLYGEHNDDVLQGILGLSAAEVDELRRSRVVR